LLGENIGVRKVSVYTSRQFLISGKISQAVRKKSLPVCWQTTSSKRHQVVGIKHFGFNAGMPAYVPHGYGQKDEPPGSPNQSGGSDAQELLKIPGKKYWP